MSVKVSEAVHWDPYNPVYFKDPYPVFRRLREEAPVYHNEEHGFYAISRYAEVEQGLKDFDTFSSSRGAILEMVKANLEFPSSLFIFQDPPKHTAFRQLMQRMITPKRMASLEGKMRSFCAQSLDPYIGADRIDFIANLGAKLPMKVICMLLGIPEEDEEAVRHSADQRLRTEAGKPMEFELASHFEGADYDAYIEWRIKHPSDDMMTELLHAEFKDDHGKVRKLERDEILVMVNMIAGAGNETTNRLIGWMAKELSEHPDQRRALVANPKLVPQTVEETVRYQMPGPSVARYVTKDVVVHDTRIPAGSIALLIAGSANRDDRRFADGDSYNIHREPRTHLGFGFGVHACIGAQLARIEGRVALDEVIKRFPEWHIDDDHAVMAQTSTVRGWETLPAFLGPKPKQVTVSMPTIGASVQATTENVSIEGTWKLVVKGPTGPVSTVLVIENVNGALGGTQTGQGSTSAITDLKVDGSQVSWVNHVTKPMKIKVTFTGELSGNTIAGKCKAGFMPGASFSGVKE
jgi:cytochrome P450